MMKKILLPLFIATAFVLFVSNQSYAQSEVKEVKKTEKVVKTSSVKSGDASKSTVSPHKKTKAKCDPANCRHTCGSKKGTKVSNKTKPEARDPEED